MPDVTEQILIKINQQLLSELDDKLNEMKKIGENVSRAEYIRRLIYTDLYVSSKMSFKEELKVLLRTYFIGGLLLFVIRKCKEAAARGEKEFNLYLFYKDLGKEPSFGELLGPGGKKEYEKVKHSINGFNELVEKTIQILKEETGLEIINLESKKLDLRNADLINMIECYWHIKVAE